MLQISDTVKTSKHAKRLYIVIGSNLNHVDNVLCEDVDLITPVNKDMACLVSEEYFNDAYEELIPTEERNVLCDIKSPPKVSVREELSRLTHDIQELSKQIDDLNQKILAYITILKPR